MKTSEELQRMCESIANDLRTGTVDGFKPDEDRTEPTAYDYLQDMLDIEWIVDRNKEYLGARICVCFGGPNIWINTRTGRVEGFWGSESCFVPYHDALGLDDALEEMWSWN